MKKVKLFLPIIVLAVIITAVIIGIFAISNSKKATIYNSAVESFEDGNYGDAVMLFTSLGAYKDSGDRLLESKWAQANDLYKQKNFREAYRIFASMDYKESIDYANECKYQAAIEASEQGAYTEAKQMFDSLGDYKSAAKSSQECQDNLDYLEAVKLFKNGEYEKAQAAFEKLGSFGDSKMYVNDCKEALGK